MAADNTKPQIRSRTPYRSVDRGYVPVVTGDFAYTAFVMDLFARRVLGWQVAGHLQADLALDALEMAIWTRRHENIDGLVHHSDRGVQPGFKGSSQHRLVDRSIGTRRAPRRGSSS